MLRDDFWLDFMPVERGDGVVEHSLSFFQPPVVLPRSAWVLYRCIGASCCSGSSRRLLLLVVKIPDVVNLIPGLFLDPGFALLLGCGYLSTTTITGNAVSVSGSFLAWAGTTRFLLGWCRKNCDVRSSFSKFHDM